MPACAELDPSCSTLSLISRRSCSITPRISFKPCSRISMRCCWRVNSALAFDDIALSLAALCAIAFAGSSKLANTKKTIRLFITTIPNAKENLMIAIICCNHSKGGFRQKLGKKKRSDCPLFSIRSNCLVQNSCSTAVLCP